MQEPIFSVITTGRGEKDTKALEETFNNWEVAKKVFEEKTGKSNAIEFLVADAGENADFPKICDCTVISPKEYEKYLKETNDNTFNVIVSTASPYKFSRAVAEAILSNYKNYGELELLVEINKLSGVPIPEGLSNLNDRSVRFKDNIETIETPLDKISNLRGVKFDWRKEEFPDKNFSSDRQIGMIAQEVEEYYPELVTTGKDGYKGLAYDKFTAVLLEAIKELKQEVDGLKAEIKELQGE